MDIWIVGTAAALLVATYGWYAFLIVRRNRVREALGSIDVQLQKRHDLLPNVLKLAAKFMAHEKELMIKITAIRERFEAPYTMEEPQQVQQHLQAGTQLRDLMNTLFVRAEQYPDLRSSDTIITAQQTYTEVEGHLAAARRFYNSSVAELNNAIQIPPGQLIAGLARVRIMPFYEAETEGVRAAVSVDDHLA